MFVSKN
jgi:hypothetical protein